jgi:phospholipid/cholesterol/gamma-HCH transport system substrate-binding protein
VSTAARPHYKRKSIAGPLIKSIIFIVVTALATAVLGLSIASTGVSSSVGYSAIFSDVTGVVVGSDVDISGVRVGQVTGLSVVDRNLAQVNFTIQSGRKLPASVTATIYYLNLVGQRYIQLGQGSDPNGPVLKPGSTIPLAQTTPALNLTVLFNGFQPLFQALSPGDVNQLSGELIQVLQGESGNVQSLIANIGSLTTSVAAKNKVIDSVIDNLNTVLKTIDSRGSALSNLVSTLQQLVSGLAADRQPIGAAISAMSQLTTATAGLLQVGRAPLKQDIIQLGRLASNLDTTAATSELNSFLKDLPAKMSDIARLASYGSWLNFYMCDALVSGVKSSYGGKPPTGVGITAARCQG